MTDKHLDGTLADRYEIATRLGAGGMGEVYRARDQKLRRDVAIKRLAPQLAGDESHRRRFLREARSAARITHQGVAGLYDVVEDGDELYLVMEYVEGVTLRGAAREPREVDEAVRMMIEVTRAIAAAHHEGVVHYDIKPGNLMLTPDGHLKVLDFGLAQIAAKADPEGSTLSFLSESGNIAGTPPYMAPEVLLGKQADHRADLFSLGVVFYQLLTGKNPFLASTPTAVVDRILNLDPPPVVMLNPAVPESIQPILRKLLAKRPDQRYATADDLLVDLREVDLQLTHPELTSPDLKPVQPPANWWPVARLLAALFIVVGVGAALLWALDWPAETTRAPAPAVSARTVGDLKSGNLLLTVLPQIEDASDPGAAARTRGMARRLTTKLQPLATDFQLVHADARPEDLADSAYSKSSITSVAAARRALGVNFVLVLDVQRQKDRIEVSLGLVDADSGRHLAAETIPGRADAPIDLGSETARRALRMLQIELSAMQRARLPAGTTDERAYGYFVTAEGYLDGEQIEIGIEQLEQALRVDPEYVAAHALLGEALLASYREQEDEVQLERARSACDEAASLDPGSQEAQACRGRVLVAEGRYEQAIPVLTRAFELDPTHFGVIDDLADAHDRRGDTEAVESVLLEAIELQPHVALLYDRLGYYRINAGEYEGAMEAFERTVQLAPDNYVVFSNLGVAYYQVARWPEAREAFDNTIRLNPDYYVAYSNNGTLTFFEGDYAAAAGYFEKALALDATDYQVWHNLAESYRQIGRESETPPLFKKAAELARPVLDDDPANTALRASVGYFLIMSGERAAGDRELRRAEREADGDATTLHTLAGVAQKRGDTERALALLAEAIDNGYSIAEVRADPTFAELRGTPEWEEVVESWR